MQSFDVPLWRLFDASTSSLRERYGSDAAVHIDVIDLMRLSQNTKIGTPVDHASGAFCFLAVCSGVCDVGHQCPYLLLA